MSVHDNPGRGTPRPPLHVVNASGSDGKITLMRTTTSGMTISKRSKTMIPGKPTSLMNKRKPMERTSCDGASKRSSGSDKARTHCCRRTAYHSRYRIPYFSFGRSG